MDFRDAHRDRLIAEIERVFDDVSREDGITLHEADVIDYYGSEQEMKLARRKDREARWQDVPEEEIEKCYNSLAHLDAKGLRYYLPAFMRWTVRHARDSDSLSSDFTIYILCPNDDKASLSEDQLKRFAAFDTHQARSICSFLRFVVEYDGGYLDTCVARQALGQYWGRYCDPH